MTYEKALKECREWFNLGGIGEIDGIAFNMALNSLEKQIPMKPENGQDDNFYWWLVCPKCKHVLLEEFYCPECGQHIDWSDEE